jgi:hypothetical protein
MKIKTVKHIGYTLGRAFAIVVAVSAMAIVAGCTITFLSELF